MKKHGRTFWSGLLLTVLVFALLIGAALFVMNSLGSSSDEEQIALIKDTVHNALMTCYALEGAYPSSLEYLQENYNLSYDTTRYIVFYDAFASNVMPRVQVRTRGDGLQ